MSTNTTKEIENSVRELAMGLYKDSGYGKQDIRNSYRRWTFEPDMDLIDRVLADMDIPEAKPSFQNRHDLKVHESKTRLEAVEQKLNVD